MAQPPAYDRAFNFQPLAPANIPEAGARVNAEYDTLKGVLNAIIANLALIQRDDGALGNLAVHPEALSARTRTLIGGGWALRGNWTAGVAYKAKDVVAFQGTLYVALVDHTATTFAADLAVERWLIWYQESNVPGDGTITTAKLSPAFSLPFARLGNYTTALTGGVARSLQAVLDQTVHAHRFGATGDGVTDDTAALNAAASAAASVGAVLRIGRGTFRTTGTVTVPNGCAGLVMEGVIRYAGAGGVPALVIGASGSTKQQAKSYRGVRVLRDVQSNWATEADVGVRFFNIDACDIEITEVTGFTIGVQFCGDQTGCEDSTIRYGRIIDNKVAVDLRTLTASGWMNSLRHIGGHFACSSSTNTAVDRFGFRFSKEPGAYNLHNAHVFVGPAFELQNQGGAINAIPFLVEVAGRGILARGIRMEACSNRVARHTDEFNDAVYELAFVGTHGFLVGIDYVGVTRAGGTVVPYHQAAAVQEAPRLVANCPDVRAVAFRNTLTDSDGVGFEGLAVLSGNPAGPPTTLNGFCFGGLGLMTLNADSVTLPTSRALAFVVDCTSCKDFVIAADGAELRPVVMQFDASENVLGNAATVMFSNANAVWTGLPNSFWEMNADLDGLTGGLALNRHQRITLHSSAAFAVIGVRGSSPTAALKALRLYTSALNAPRVLAGGTRAWGTREMAASATWSVPSLGAGATSTFDITVPGVRQGDFVQAGFTKDTGFQNGGVVFHASVGGTGGTNQVRVTAHNVSAGTIVVGDGTLRVRAVRPKL